MGFIFSKILDSFSKNKNFKILMLGLNNAGKTTILHKLNLGEIIHTAPSILISNIF